MLNNKAPEAPEWLNDAEERRTRFRELGLSANQSYSTLSDEEKQFMNFSKQERNLIEESYEIFASRHDEPTEQRESFRRNYIKTFISWYNVLSDNNISPDKREAHKLNLSLTDAIFNLDIPEEKIRTIMLLMSQDDTPNFVKQMVSFKIQHPIDRLDDEFSSHSVSSLFRQSLSSGVHITDNQQIQSNILNASIFKDGYVMDVNGNAYTTEDIIYHDLLKCSFESGGHNIEYFLSKLRGGDFMMKQIMCWPDSEVPIQRYYSDEDIDSLQTLIRQLHSMYYQTHEGEDETYDTSLHNVYSRGQYGRRSITEVKKEIRTIYNEYRPSGKQSLADRVVQSFCSPLGISSLSEAFKYIGGTRAYSRSRHEILSFDGGIGTIEKGDFVKSVVSSEYLPYILESGVLSKEYLGVGEFSDETPLDTDVSMILENPHGLRDALSKTSAAAFSDMKESGAQHYYGAKESVFLVFHNDNRFKNYNNGTIYFDKDKYEVCRDGLGRVVKKRGANQSNNGWFSDDYDDYDDNYYNDDYGIRTGIPSSEIDYIATDTKSARKVIEAVKNSGLYIPVTDLDGNIIYNPCRNR